MLHTGVETMRFLLIIFWLDGTMLTLETLNYIHFQMSILSEMEKEIIAGYYYYTIIIQANISMLQATVRKNSPEKRVVPV